MLYTLGIGSAVALSGAVVTIICDSFPQLKYWTVALGTCILGFVVGLVYVTPVSKTALLTYKYLFIYVGISSVMRGNVVVMALCYKPAGRGFDAR
jgi:solute carrier family 6 amino acid transporter-like protein 5/7/9/14